MRDFYGEWNRMSKWNARLRWFALGWIGFVAVLVVSAICATIYVGATSSPEDIGRFFGSIISGFQEGQSDGNG